MGLFFSSEPQGFLGLDIGYGGIKLAEIRQEKGRARLVTYAYANVSSDRLDQSLLNDPQATADLVKKMIAKARVTTKRTVAALPISAVFSSMLHVPTTDEKAIKQAVEAQAKKLIPLPLEEVALDTKLVDKIEKGEAVKASSRVLMTAAPKSLVAKYVEIAKLAGLELKFLETEAFAEIRSLIGKDRATIMIVDIGSLRTNIVVVEKGIPFVMRSIATGGMAMTQTIARTLGIPPEQAETMKRDITAMQKSFPAGDLTPVLSILVKSVLDEIRYSLSSYMSQMSGNEGQRVEKLILTGGSSLLPHLAEFLTQQTGINAYLGNPWARVVYPLELKPILQELGPRFAVTIGCAMHDPS